jgi:hypothetical protein
MIKLNENHAVHVGPESRDGGRPKSNTIDQELSSFASQLCGLGGMEVDHAVAMLDDLNVPSGYQHIRLTIFKTVEYASNGHRILGDGVDGGTMVDTWEEQLDLSEIVLNCQCAASMETYYTECETVWADTFALPTKAAGVLELGLVLEPISRAADPARR